MKSLPLPPGIDLPENIRESEPEPEVSPVIDAEVSESVSDVQQGLVIDGAPEAIAEMRQESRELGADFEKSLEAYDAARGDGKSLTDIWRKCLRFHDDNVMLRTNMAQLQVILQENMAQWTQTRMQISRAIQQVTNPKDEDDGMTSGERMEQLQGLLDMQEKTCRLLTHLTTTIREAKKEIRQTEFQSRYFVHINLIQQAFTALTAVLFKHLTSTDKLQPIINEMRKISRMLGTEAEKALE